ncbi:MAG: phosphotransferase [Chlamydiales bacterium]|nr:phosphotransferase [Chlamydiales bacterium]
MANAVGIYRGSFDPPHNGHLEAVNYVLKTCMASVTIVYKDLNSSKPFRSNNKIRKKLLKTMFKDMQNVVISKKTYEAALIDLLSDSTIIKIYHIISSKTLDKPIWPIGLSTKLAYFIIPKRDYPIVRPVSSWNNLPAETTSVEHFTERYHSSSELRALLFERNFQTASLGLPALVFDQILSQNFFVSSENEYSFRTIIQDVKKIVENEIVLKNSVPIEKYPLSFHIGNDIGISGLSNDKVCFVKDKDEQICLVVKVFLGNDYKGNYESELLGYATLKKLNLHLIRIPELFFSHQKENFAFIGMSFVLGKSLAEMMQASPEAIRLCAQANLELHLAQRSLATEISAQQIAVYEEVIVRVTDRLSNIQTSFLPPDIAAKLKTRWLQKHLSFVANPGLLSFTHGDPNHSNWIVDLDNHCVTYIDLSLFKRSISPQETPSGFAINEVEEALIMFRVAGKQRGNLSNEQIREIQDIYVKEYMDHAPVDITTPEAKDYFFAYWSLRIIEEILKDFINTDVEESKLKYQAQLIKKIDSFLSDS